MMDIGCRFFTPNDISEYIANFAGSQDLVVDLFAGGGNLHQAFLRNKLAKKALALDINPEIMRSTLSEELVEAKVVNCLDVGKLEDVLDGFLQSKMTFVLNPPFKRITALQEKAYWSQFNDYCPTNLTQRVECIAIASAIQAAPPDSSFYIIVPQLVLQSEKTAHFFSVLKKKYSLRVIKDYKKALFSSAEVDVTVIELEKKCNGCFTEAIKHHPSHDHQLILKKKPNASIGEFLVFRGLVRNPIDREHQISAKHLKLGGTQIKGSLKVIDCDKKGIKNVSLPGDILITRVGRRMLGRVGILNENAALTNESIFNLRISNRIERRRVYNALKATSFADWCQQNARGTANYFLTKDVIEHWVSNAIITT